MPNDDTTSSYSAEQLRRMRAEGRSRSDLARVRAAIGRRRDGDMAEDLDAEGIPQDWFASAETIMPSGKRMLSLRLDADVIDYFREQGPGYQTRINAVLSVFVRERKREQARKPTGQDEQRTR